VLKDFGCSVEKPSSGSHWKARAANGAMYPLPAGNGLRTELGDKYIKGLCRNLGIDEGEFFKKLRG
jgi:hypothetical protein